MRITLYSILGSIGSLVHASPSQGPVSIDSPNEEAHLSFYINQLERVVLATSSTEMSAAELVGIATAREPRKMDKSISEQRLAADVASVIEEASSNPWNIFKGRDIFTLCDVSWNVRLHVCRQVVEALMEIPYESIDEARSMSRFIGFHDFAVQNSQWLLLTFAGNFDRVQILLDDDFDATRGSLVIPLNEDALEEIRTGAAQIQDATDDNDILVFIGNSASYYYHAIQHGAQSTYLLPFSGGWISNKYGEDPSEIRNFEKYEQVYLDPIRREAQESEKTIVLVDITVTANTVDIIYDFLKFRRCEDCYIEVIQILSDQGPEAAETYTAPKNVRVRTLVHSINGCSDNLLLGVHPRLVPHFSAAWWHFSTEGMLDFYASRKTRLSEITKIRNYVASKGFDWPHTNSPMVDLIEYLALLGIERNVPVLLPLYYWTETFAKVLQYHSDKETVQQVEISHLESKPIESMAQVAYRLHKLETSMHRYFRNHVEGEVEAVESYSMSLYGDDDEEPMSPCGVEDWTDLDGIESGFIDAGDQGSLQLGFDIFSISDPDDSVVSPESDLEITNFGDWAFQAIDLAKQDEYVRDALMPGLKSFADRFPAIRAMMSVFGEESTHF